MLKKILFRIFVVLASLIVLFVAFALLMIFGETGVSVSYGYPVWSDDGSRIYYTKGVLHMKNDVLGEKGYKDESYLLSMRPDGLLQRTILAYKNKYGTETGKFIKHIIRVYGTLSNDKEVLFCLYENENEEYGLYKINTDGTGLTRLVNFGEIVKAAPEVFISPDKKKLAYMMPEHDEHGKPIEDSYSSWVCDADGNNNQMICGADSYVEGWTADGKIMIDALTDLKGNLLRSTNTYDNKAKYGEDMQYQIMIYDPSNKKMEMIPYKTGNEAKAIRQKQGLIEDTGISPDGKRQVFVQDSMSIGIRDVDGKNELMLFKGRLR